MTRRAAGLAGSAAAVGLLLLVLACCRGNGRGEAPAQPAGGAPTAPAAAEPMPPLPPPPVPPPAAASPEAAPRPAPAPAAPGPVPAGPAVEITTGAELGPAIGKLVRVRGTAEREKMGDSVRLGGGRLVCFDQRFPDDRIGQEVTVEGLLARRTDLGATVGPNGEVSQGVAPGTAVWTLSNCALR